MSNPDLKVSVALQEITRDLKSNLEEAAGERIGFILLTVPLGRVGELNYISNVDRAESKNILEQQLAHWKRGNPDVPFHRKN